MSKIMENSSIKKLRLLKCYLFASISVGSIIALPFEGRASSDVISKNSSKSQESLSNIIPKQKLLNHIERPKLPTKRKPPTRTFVKTKAKFLNDQEELKKERPVVLNTESIQTNNTAVIVTEPTIEQPKNSKNRVAKVFSGLFRTKSRVEHREQSRPKVVQNSNNINRPLPNPPTKKLTRFQEQQERRNRIKAEVLAGKKKSATEVREDSKRNRIIIKKNKEEELIEAQLKVEKQRARQAALNQAKQEAENKKTKQINPAKIYGLESNINASSFSQTEREPINIDNEKVKILTTTPFVANFNHRLNQNSGVPAPTKDIILPNQDLPFNPAVSAQKNYANVGFDEIKTNINIDDLYYSPESIKFREDHKKTILSSLVNINSLNDSQIIDAQIKIITGSLNYVDVQQYEEIVFSAARIQDLKVRNYVLNELKQKQEDIVRENAAAYVALDGSGISMPNKSQDEQSKLEFIESLITGDYSPRLPTIYEAKSFEHIAGQHEEEIEPLKSQYIISDQMLKTSDNKESIEEPYPYISQPSKEFDTTSNVKLTAYSLFSSHPSSATVSDSEDNTVESVPSSLLSTPSGSSISINDLSDSEDNIDKKFKKLLNSEDNFDELEQELEEVFNNSQTTLLNEQAGDTQPDESTSESGFSTIADAKEEEGKEENNKQTIDLAVDETTRSSLQSCESSDQECGLLRLKDSSTDEKDSKIETDPESEEEKLEQLSDFELEDTSMASEKAIEETEKAIAAIPTTTNHSNKTVNTIASFIRNMRLEVPNLGAVTAAGDEDLSIQRGFWMRTMYGVNNQGRVNNINGYRGINKGATIGFDAQIENNIIGIAYSNVRSVFKFKNNKNNDKETVNSHVVSIYGQKELPKNFVAQALVSASKNLIKNKTTYSLGDAKFKSKVKHHNHSYNAEGLLNYNYLLKDSNIIITPNIGLRYGKSRDGVYNEVGSSVQEIALTMKENNILSGIIGSKARIPLKNVLKFNNLGLTMHAAVEHNFSEKTQRVNRVIKILDNKFVQNYIVPKQPKTAYNLGSSVIGNIKNTTISLEYNYYVNKYYHSHQGSIKLKVNL